MPREGGAHFSPIFAADGRMRAPLRLGLYVVLTALVVVVLQVIAINVAVFLFAGPTDRSPASDLTTLPYLLAAEVASFVGVTSVTLLARRRFDRRSFVSLGLQRYRGWRRDLSLGLLLGLVLMMLVFLTEWATGLIVWEMSTPLPLWQLAGAAILFMMVAWSEELLVRGYILQNIAEAWGAVPAVITSSLLFSFLHFANPGADLMSGIGLVLAGILFAVAFFAADALWLPMALHFAWNFAEGPIFGFPVSGLHLSSILSTTQLDLSFFTGGYFGPEAGLSGLMASAVGIAICFAYGRWRKTS